MRFILTSDQLAVFREKFKVYTYLSNLFTKSSFKLSEGKLTLVLRGNCGLIQTVTSTDYSGESQYFSVDLNKWITALQKYNIDETLVFDLTKNSLKISSSNTGVITLSISTFSKDSQEAVIIDSFISKKREEYSGKNLLTLSEDLVDSLNLANSFFNTQLSDKINSIGLGRHNIVYADRSVVLKINITDSVSEEFFSELSNNEDYVYIPTFMIKLFSLLYKTRNEISFASNYSLIYWEDDDSALVLMAELRKIALPTEEEFNNIKPRDPSTGFDILAGEFKDSLNFFNGFYEGSIWKPITLHIETGKEVSLHYNHPTTEINKVLSNTTPNISGDFQIDSETIKKFVIKVCDKFGEDTLITANCDPDALGIYFTAAGKYEVVLTILED